MNKEKKLGYWLTKREVILLILLGAFVVALCGLFCYRYLVSFSYRSSVLPNTYLGNYDISNLSFDQLRSFVSSYSEEILNEEVLLLCQGKEYHYQYRDLGVGLDIDSMVQQITEYQESLGFLEKYDDILDQDRTSFLYLFSVDEEKLRSFLTQLKEQVDVHKVDGRLLMDDNRTLQYVNGIDGFSLDVDKSFIALREGLEDSTSSLELVGEVDSINDNSLYQSIDTKISSFTTSFNPSISRAVNLKTGLRYIDGVILMPGEVFSFYKYAGPYHKKGYVFYYEYVGNGVCQIATTVYNTALLGGLEIVKRSPHSAKSPYVPGGLDATVVSSTSGWNIDFQFKNTYSYPIYISAYATGGEAHVDFWSNKEALGGKSYSTESVQIGTRGYTTYLHTYQNGVWVSREKIATTWYSKDG